MVKVNFNGYCSKISYYFVIFRSHFLAIIFQAKNIHFLNGWYTAMYRIILPQNICAFIVSIERYCGWAANKKVSSPFRSNGLFAQNLLTRLNMNISEGIIYINKTAHNTKEISRCIWCCIGYFFKSHVPRINLSDFAKKYFPTCCHHQQIFYQMACTCFTTVCCKSETHFLFSCLAIIHIIWQVGKLQERYIVVLTAQPRFHFFPLKSCLPLFVTSD